MFICKMRFQPPTDNVHEVMTKTNQLVKSRVPVVRKSLSLYLANEETEHILFRPCRVSGWVVMLEHASCTHAFSSTSFY